MYCSGADCASAKESSIVTVHVSAMVFVLCWALCKACALAQAGGMSEHIRSWAEQELASIESSGIYKQKAALVQINAPVALLQVELNARRHVLLQMLAECSNPVRPPEIADAGTAWQPQYKSFDGMPVSLNRLCRDEPEWAASRITALTAFIHGVAKAYTGERLGSEAKRCIGMPEGSGHG